MKIVEIEKLPHEVARYRVSIDHGSRCASFEVIFHASNFEIVLTCVMCYFPEFLDMDE